MGQFGKTGLKLLVVGVTWEVAVANVGALRVPDGQQRDCRCLQEVCVAAVHRHPVAATCQGQSSEPGVAAGTDGKGGGFEGVLRVSKLGSRFTLLQQHVVGAPLLRGWKGPAEGSEWGWGEIGQMQSRAVTCASALEARAPMMDLAQHC